VRVLDQRRLPHKVSWITVRSGAKMRHAIQSLAVRGAPAIGVAGAKGLVVATAAVADKSRERFDVEMRKWGALLAGARPTAVNLKHAVFRVVRRMFATPGSAREMWEAGRAEADAIEAEDIAMCAAIGRHGLEFVPEGARVLTHCNAGALATAGIGTALAPVYMAHEARRRISVVACETRPLLQGSRLTAWELSRAGVPVRVITDSMAAALMARGEVDVVLVGADRIARNGDTANKIGTYSHAIAARHHGIPFVVCAPQSTLDPQTPTGTSIEIEERDADEVLGFGKVRAAPKGANAWNPAFDVTPADLITAIVTNHGVHRPTYKFDA
jgi:methylthioribose-1-phosphate isomerase